MTQCAYAIVNWKHSQMSILGSCGERPKSKIFCETLLSVQSLEVLILLFLSVLSVSHDFRSSSSSFSKETVSSSHDSDGAGLSWPNPIESPRYGKRLSDAPNHSKVIGQVSVLECRTVAHPRWPNIAVPILVVATRPKIQKGIKIKFIATPQLLRS